MKTYVVALPGSPRRASLSGRLSDWPNAVEIVDAVDGRRLSEAELAASYDAARASARLGRGMGRAEIGCALSHLSVYRRIASSRAAYSVVFEDDARPLPSASAMVEEATRGGDFDLLSLFSGCAVVLTGNDGSAPVDGTLRVVGRMDHTVAYVISRDFATRILEETAGRVYGLADWPVDLSTARCFVVARPAVRHENGGSAIVTERTFRTRSVAWHALDYARKSLASRSAGPWKRFTRDVLSVSLVRRGWIPGRAVICHEDTAQ